VTTIFFSICFHDVSLCFCIENMLDQPESHEPNHARVKPNLQDSKLAFPRSRLD